MSRAAEQPNRAGAATSSALQPPNLSAAPASRILKTSAATILKGMTLDELEAWVSSELNEKKFRGRQLFRWMYQKCSNDIDEMTDMSKALRERLASVAQLDALQLDEVHESDDGTKKAVFIVPRTGGKIETVWIPTKDRVTLCVSSQIGCALGCEFCLTAKMGLRAHLTVGEIVDQVVWSKRLFEREKRLSNIVFMGMGEPLHNYDNVLGAFRLLIDDRGLNFSRRKITVSTVGLVPAIERLGQEDIDVSLAVSLNATTDEVRDEIMPINRRYNIRTLLDTLRRFPLPKRARITIEYVMLRGLNDSDEDAHRLTRLLRGIPVKINLIPWNPHAGTEFERPSRRRVLEFQAIVERGYYNCRIRETRGDDTMAACGQLGGGADGVVPKRVKRARNSRAEVRSS